MYKLHNLCLVALSDNWSLTQDTVLIYNTDAMKSPTQCVDRDREQGVSSEAHLVSAWQLEAEAGLIADLEERLKVLSLPVLFCLTWYIRALAPRVPFGKSLFGGRGINGGLSNFRVSVQNFSMTVRRNHGRDPCKSCHQATCRDWSPLGLWRGLLWLSPTTQLLTLWELLLGLCFLKLCGH